MKKKLLILSAFIMLVATVTASQGYWILFSEDGYVAALTAHSPAPIGYIYHQVGEIPKDVLCGYYRLVDGEFVVDPDKRSQWEADNPEPEGEED